MGPLAKRIAMLPVALVVVAAWIAFDARKVLPGVALLVGLVCLQDAGYLSGSWAFAILLLAIALFAAWCWARVRRDRAFLAALRGRR
jgi:hypothetical protein